MADSVDFISLGKILRLLWARLRLSEKYIAMDIMKKTTSLFAGIISLSTLAFADNEDFSGQILQGKDFSNNSYINTNFSNSELDYSKFSNSTLTGANFTDSTITNVNFSGVIGFTEEQLKSTKSYKDKKLRSITFSDNDFSAWDFSGQNLEYSFMHDMALVGTNFANADLTDAQFVDSVFTNADFTNAIVKGAAFHNATGLTYEQLKSTKSYQDKDLGSIGFYGGNLNGWDFSGQSMSEANLGWTTLKNATFVNADLSDAYFYHANMTNVDFRGANVEGTDFDNATYKNTIMSDGVIKDFSMVSADDNFSVGKYTPAASGGAVISAKISESDSTISGGAKLTLEQGAVFEITNGKTLTVASDGSIQIDTDLSGSTVFNVDGNAGLAFEDGAILTVNVVDSIAAGEAYTFTVISFDGDSAIAGLAGLIKGETLLLTINGVKFGGAWDYIVNGNSLSISISSIPEPATCAVALGGLAIAFAFMRRRR